MCSSCDEDERYFALEDARDEIRILRTALADLRDHGIHADTAPTMVGGGRDTIWWYDYLRRADKTVREIARKAIEDADAIV